MTTTIVTLKATGPKGSGKSFLLDAIQGALKGYGIRCSGGSEHERSFELPANAQASIAQFNASRIHNDELTKKQIEERHTAFNRLSDEKSRLRKETFETRAQFADLKQRLYAAEIENARLRGYIAHAQETEDAARPPLHCADSRMVPAPTPRRQVLIEQLAGGKGAIAMDAERRAEHWTNYGSPGSR